MGCWRCTTRGDQATFVGRKEALGAFADPLIVGWMPRAAEKQEHCL